MSSAVRGGFRLPAFLRIEEELMGGDRKGIGTILGFSSAEKLRTENRKSLRRTFSADMSSKKWMAQQLQSPLKKTSSSQEFSEMSVIDSSSSLSSSSSDEEEEKEEKIKDLEKRPGQMDIWNLIQSHKTGDSTPPLPAPYIHPLVKRSLSKLSEKSLQICTESLGSETGADCLPIASNASEDRNKKQEDGIVSIVEEDLKDKRKQLEVVDYRYSTVNRRSTTRSFPPPLPSISRRDGSRLYMRSHRKDGRLVVEAISIPPSPKCFDANRRDGRLVLSFMNTPPKEAKEEEVVVKEEAIVAGEEEEEDYNEGEEVEEDGDNKKGIVLELKILQKEVAATVMKVHLSNPWMKRALEEVEDTKVVKLAPDAAADQVAIVSKKAPLVVKVEEILPMMMRCMEMWPVVRLPHCITTI